MKAGKYGLTHITKDSLAKFSKQYPNIRSKECP